MPPSPKSKVKLTAIDKRPQGGRVVVGELGLAGDTQYDSKHHGGPDQALYLYAREDAGWWAAELVAAASSGTPDRRASRSTRSTAGSRRSRTRRCRWSWPAGSIWGCSTSPACSRPASVMRPPRPCRWDQKRQAFGTRSKPAQLQEELARIGIKARGRITTTGIGRSARSPSPAVRPAWGVGLRVGNLVVQIVFAGGDGPPGGEVGAKQRMKVDEFKRTMAMIVAGTIGAVREV